MVKSIGSFLMEGVEILRGCIHKPGLLHVQRIRLLLATRKLCNHRAEAFDREQHVIGSREKSPDSLNRLFVNDPGPWQRVCWAL
jgi:hypothetical protein